MLTRAIAEANVEAGMALFDRTVPDWELAMNVHKLNVYDPELCPLGQLFGDYAVGGDTIGLLDDDGLIPYGLNAFIAKDDTLDTVWNYTEVGIDEYVADCKLLTRTWKKKLVARLRQKGYRKARSMIVEGFVQVFRQLVWLHPHVSGT